jgi:hypothetical protein
VSLGTAILFKITHCQKSTFSHVYHDLPPLFCREGLDGSSVLTMYSTIYGNVYGNVALGNSLRGLKLDLGNCNTEFFEGRNR